MTEAQRAAARTERRADAKPVQDGLPSGALTLQFHPDWPFRGGLVIEAIVRDGRYRSQFETGISNGGLTARPGGDRWRWESRLFEGRYDDGPATARPVYGAWNRRHDPYGGSPRFGSAHLRLKDHVLERTTFCFPDSVYEPTETGGTESLPRLIGLAETAGHDLLDDYIEAQVHGGLDLATDVEAVVLDPCHQEGPVADTVEARDWRVEFHPGHRALTAELPEDYRGPEPLKLAARLGEELTPDIVAGAARSGDHDPQTVKRVWHLLARFGRHG